MDIKTALNELNEIWDSNNDRLYPQVTAEDIERVREDVNQLPPEDAEVFSGIFKRIDKVLEGEQVSAPLFTTEYDEPVREIGEREFIEEEEEIIQEEILNEEEEEFFDFSSELEKKEKRKEQIREGKKKNLEAAQREKEGIEQFNSAQEMYRKNDMASKHYEWAKKYTDISGYESIGETYSKSEHGISNFNATARELYTENNNNYLSDKVTPNKSDNTLNHYGNDVSYQKADKKLNGDFDLYGETAEITGHKDRTDYDNSFDKNTTKTAPYRETEKALNDNLSYKHINNTSHTSVNAGYADLSSKRNNTYAQYKNEANYSTAETAFNRNTSTNEGVRYTDPTDRRNRTVYDNTVSGRTLYGETSDISGKQNTVKSDSFKNAEKALGGDNTAFSGKAVYGNTSDVSGTQRRQSLKDDTGKSFGKGFSGYGNASDVSEKTVYSNTASGIQRRQNLKADTGKSFAGDNTAGKANRTIYGETSDVSGKHNDKSGFADASIDSFKNAQNALGGNSTDFSGKANRTIYGETSDVSGKQNTVKSDSFKNAEKALGGDNTAFSGKANRTVYGNTSDVSGKQRAVKSDSFKNTLGGDNTAGKMNRTVYGGASEKRNKTFDTVQKQDTFATVKNTKKSPSRDNFTEETPKNEMLRISSAKINKAVFKTENINAKLNKTVYSKTSDGLTAGNKTVAPAFNKINNGILKNNVSKESDGGKINAAKNISSAKNKVDKTVAGSKVSANRARDGLSGKKVNNAAIVTNAGIYFANKTAKSIKRKTLQEVADANKVKTVSAYIKNRDRSLIYNSNNQKSNNYLKNLLRQAAVPGTVVMNTMASAAFGEQTSKVNSTVRTGVTAAVFVSNLAIAASATASIADNGLTGRSNIRLQGKTMKIDGETIKVAGNYHSFTATTATKKLNSFKAQNASIVREFVNDKGKIDTKKLNGSIKDLKAKITNGTATAADKKRLNNLLQFSGLAKNSAQNNARRSAIKGLNRAGTSLISTAFASDPTARTMTSATRAVITTSKAGVKAVKLGGAAVKLTGKEIKAVVNKTGIPNTKLVRVTKGKIQKSKQAITLGKKNIAEAIKSTPGIQKASQTVKNVKSGYRKFANSAPMTAARKVSSKFKKAAGTAKKVVTAPAKAATKAVSGLSYLKKIIIGAVAVIALCIFMFTLLALMALSLFATFSANDNTLQKYINYAVKVSQKWEDGKYADSKVEVLKSDGTYTKAYSLNEIYDLDGNETGRWRIITTIYVDEEGNEIDSTDNLKEILSMVAVKIDNNWAGWSSSDDSELDADNDSEDDDYDYEYETETDEDGNVIENDYTIKKSDIKKMIKYLYLASHSIEATETEPYYYTVELNNLAVSYLLDGETITETLVGDAEGEGCQTRTFYCNEEITDEDYSEFRYTLCNSDYFTRGGCEISYSGSGTYNAATDTIVLDSETQDGKTKYTNAHSLSWATDEMIELWETSQANGGEGDEVKYKHNDGEAMDSLPSGCKSYEISYAHGDDNGESTNTPDSDCSNYSVSLPSNTTTITLPSDCTAIAKVDSFSKSFILTWSYASKAYYYNYQNSSGTYTRVEIDSMTTYLGDEITYYKNSDDGKYYPEDTVFTCEDTAYYCLEEEYYCSGHTIEDITIYYCPGHTEYYCDGNHYDITVEITIDHMDDESIYEADVDNDYDYKRKAVAVSEYPEDFDRLSEDLSSDFYWSYDNIEWAEQLADGDWNELYDIYGIEDISSVLDEDNIDTYFEYLEVETIYGWATASDGNGGTYEYPLDIYGEAIDFDGGQWFYDSSGGEYDGQYVYVYYYYTVYDYSTGVSARSCAVTEISESNPLAVSDERIEFVKYALSCVGVIPYEEDGAPYSYSLEDFGVDEDGNVIRGLSSGGFVNFCLIQVGLGITKTSSIKSIYNYTYSIDGSETTTYYSTGNLDDLSSVDWSEYENASELRQAIIDRALEVVESGIPYIWGGTSLTSGVDCSGFIGSVYAEFGILDSSKASAHAYTSYVFRSLGYAVDYEDVQPGDVLCYDGHVAFYLDENHIIEACNSEIGLRVYECNPFTYDGGVITIRSLIIDEEEHSDTYTSSSTTTISISLTETALSIYQYFVDNTSLNDKQIAGIMGNLAADSSMLSNYCEGGTEYIEEVEDGTITKNTFINDGVAVGLFYFKDKEMKTYLYNYTIAKGLSLTDVEGQCEAFYNYIADNYKTTGFISAMNEADTATEAASAYRTYVENTMGKELSDTSTSIRQAYAAQYYNLLTGKSSVGGYEDELLPGDIGLINTYYGRIEDGTTVYNQAAIYLGENELGQQLWISCSASTGWASVITSSAFRYYRRLECW